MINYELGFLIAVTAVVYSYLLTRPNAIFNGLYNWMYEFFKTDQRQANGKPFHWAFMILIHCEKCIAGQAAFWLFLFCHLSDYNFLTHIFFTAFTIITAGAIAEIYKNYIQKT
jgi:hypothetical protein